MKPLKFNYLLDQYDYNTTKQTDSFLNNIGEDVAPLILFNLLLDYSYASENSFDKYLSKVDYGDYCDISLAVNCHTKKWFIIYVGDMLENKMQNHINSRSWVQDISDGITMGIEGVNMVDNYCKYFFKFLNNFRLKQLSTFNDKTVNFIPSPDVFRNVVKDYVDNTIRYKIFNYLDNETYYFRDEQEDIRENILDDVLKNCKNLIFIHDYSEKLKTNNQIISLMRGKSEKFEELISFEIDFNGIIDYYNSKYLSI